MDDDDYPDYDDADREACTLCGDDGGDPGNDYVLPCPECGGSEQHTTENGMSTEFKREDRYIVFKLSDVERYLTDADRAHLAMMKNEIDAGRDCANKPPFKGLIVESDWPEYEPTWKAIEARMTGSPEESAAQTAARIMNNELIRERDDLLARIEAMEKQEPVAWIARGGYPVPLDKLKWQLWYGSEKPTLSWVNQETRPLYALPGAQPAPSVPEDVKRDAERYRYLRARDDGTAGVGCWLEADGRVCDRGWLYGAQLDSAIDTCIEMLAAAPEAKRCP